MDRIIKPKLPHYPSALFSSWPWKMAWRDSRTYRQRLALFLSCILLGVAALVAVRSLGDNLKQAVDDQSRTLLGADLVVNSQRAIPVGCPSCPVS